MGCIATHQDCHAVHHHHGHSILDHHLFQSKKQRRHVFHSLWRRHHTHPRKCDLHIGFMHSASRPSTCHFCHALGAELALGIDVHRTSFLSTMSYRQSCREEQGEAHLRLPCTSWTGQLGDGTCRKSTTHRFVQWRQLGGQMSTCILLTQGSRVGSRRCNRFGHTTKRTRRFRNRRPQGVGDVQQVRAHQIRSRAHTSGRQACGVAGGRSQLRQGSRVGHGRDDSDAAVCNTTVQRWRELSPRDGGNERGNPHPVTKWVFTEHENMEGEIKWDGYHSTGSITKVQELDCRGGRDGE
mmetsp:Transcript_5638/g.35010  ORF Transcript_5638/g.35010 Transcript_5638/m.35010 type:complete len:296 (+) Transcript_5638:413-1300(+)